MLLCLHCYSRHLSLLRLLRGNSRTVPSGSSAPIRQASNAVSRGVGPCTLFPDLSLARWRHNQKFSLLNFFFFWLIQTVRSGPCKYQRDSGPALIPCHQTSRAKTPSERTLLLHTRTCSLPSPRPLLKSRIQFSCKSQFQRLIPAYTS